MWGTDNPGFCATLPNAFKASTFRDCPSALVNRLEEEDMISTATSLKSLSTIIQRGYPYPNTRNAERVLSFLGTS